jgi:sugar lactone lactonase YvrE
MKIRGFQRWIFALSGAGSLLVVLWSLGATAQDQPAVLKVTTVAGGFINDGKLATSSALQNPSDVASDSKGNLYITDFFDHRIRELTTSGVLMTIAGTGIAGFNGDGGTAKKTQVNFPRGIVIDGKGNILFADVANCRIRKISPSKIVTTIAGTGTCGFSGDGLPATSAMINFPNGLSLDNSGNLYFADTFNQRIRKIDSAGIIHTLAGTGTAGFSGDGGPATSASLNFPRAAISDAGNLFIADQQNHRVRKVDASGNISTFGGNGLTGCKGDGGLATAAHLGYPNRLLILQGNLYVSNGGCARVRAINLSTDMISTAAGSTFGFDGNGHNALASQFNSGVGMLLDNAKANVLVVDNGNSQVRAVSVSTNTVSGIAGGYTGDGLKGTMASLNLPENIAFDSKGNLYIADVFNNRVRKVTPTGVISTFAGVTGISGYSGDGGPAGSAQLWFPYGVAVDKNDNIYISDNGNGVIRKVDTSGTITTLAQNANFFDLLGIAVDSGGNVYVADDLSCVVWQATPAGAVSVAAGVLNTCGYNGDGIAATSAYLNSPYDVGVDSAGNLYIGDTFNNRVREVSSGVISTFAGNGTCGFSGDGGLAKLAMLCTPVGVVADSKNNIYIGDYGNARVREVTSGNINTIAGTGNLGYNGNGLAATLTNIDGPSGLAVSSKGVFVADDGQYRVRKIH